MIDSLPEEANEQTRKRYNRLKDLVKLPEHKEKLIKALMEDQKRKQEFTNRNYG